MTSNSTQPDEPQLEGYGAEQWRQILHNASLKAASDPTNADTHRAMVQRALINLSTLNQQQNAADMTHAGQDLAGGVRALAATNPVSEAVVSLLPDRALTPLGAGVVGFGQGASLGAVQPPVVGGQSPIKMAHGTAVNVGDVAGSTALGALASPLAAGAPVVGGMMLGAGLGSARGGIGTAVAKAKGETNPGVTGDPETDAVLGGLGGLIAGGVAGKLGPPIARGVGTVGKNLVALFVKKAADEGTQLGAESAVDAAEATVRRYLAKNNYPPELIDKIVAQSRPLWAKGVQPQEGTFNTVGQPGAPTSAARLGGIEKPPPDPLETPTYLRRGTTVSQSGGTTHTTAESVDIPQALRRVAANMGRALTPQERDIVVATALEGRNPAPADIEALARPQRGASAAQLAYRQKMFKPPQDAP